MAGRRRLALALAMSLCATTLLSRGDWRMNWRDQRIDPQLITPRMPKP